MPDRRPPLSDRELAALALLREHDWLAPWQIAKALAVSAGVAGATMRKLRARGLAVRDGSRATGNDAGAHSGIRWTRR